MALLTSFALALPGCPLSDGYYVEAMLGSGGSAASAGNGGPPPPAGMPAVAGNDASGGKPPMGGREAMGGMEPTTAGRGGMAGTSGVGGTGAAGGTDVTGGTGATGGTDATGGEAGAACESETEVCDGVSNDCDADIDEDGVCPPDCSARIFREHTYILCLPAPEARLQHYASTVSCRSFAEDTSLAVPSALELVAVESREENDFLKRWLKEVTTEPGQVWMGASDVRDETIWVWGRGIDVEVQFFTGNGSGGMPYMGAFHDFAPEEPHGGADDGIDCGVFDSSVGFKWVDADCLIEPIGYICESQ